jgi:hypothetical protein
MVYPQVRITWILHQGDTCGERDSVAKLIICFCGYDDMMFSHVSSSQRHSWTPKRAKGAASILRLLSIPRLRWSTSNEDDDKVTESSLHKFPTSDLHDIMRALLQH